MIKKMEMKEKRKKLLLIAVICMLFMFLRGMTVQASEVDYKEACKQELLEMLRSADSSWHDVAEYGLGAMDINYIWWDLRENEGYLEHSACGLITVLYQMTNGKVVSMSLSGLDAEYPTRDAKLRSIGEMIKEKTQDMTDLEKVLYINEYIDDVTYYAKGEFDGWVSGPLYEGHAVCQGYAYATNYLLTYVGIPHLYIASWRINHGWNLVLLDGEWYHVDTTWNDTKGSNGKTTHLYLLRNSNEFINDLPYKHYGWTNNSTESTSTKYSNWFVHNIVGKIHYYDGLWYYVDNETGDIVRSEVDLEQSAYEILADKSEIGCSSLQIVKVEEETLYYTVDGVQQTLSLKEEEPEPEPEPEVSENNDDNVALYEWDKVYQWFSGYYRETDAKFIYYAGRICTTVPEPVEANQSYQVVVKDDSYRVMINELAADQSCIRTWNLHSGNTFKTSDQTKYIHVNVYHSKNSYDYMHYYKLFTQSTFYVRLIPAALQDVNETNQWNQEAYWRSGNYTAANGSYAVDYTKICLWDYVKAEPGAVYEAVLGNTDYRMRISELTKDKGFITTYELQNGDFAVLSDQTAYIAVSFYHPSNSSMNFDQYIDVISAGIGLQKVDAAAAALNLLILDEEPEEELTEEVLEETTEETTEEESIEEEELSEEPETEEAESEESKPEEAEEEETETEQSKTEEQTETEEEQSMIEESKTEESKSEEATTESVSQEAVPVEPTSGTEEEIIDTI